MRIHSLAVVAMVLLACSTTTTTVGGEKQSTADAGGSADGGDENVVDGGTSEAAVDSGADAGPICSGLVPTTGQLDDCALRSSTSVSYCVNVGMAPVGLPAACGFPHEYECQGSAARVGVPTARPGGAAVGDCVSWPGAGGSIMCCQHPACVRETSTDRFCSPARPVAWQCGYKPTSGVVSVQPTGDCVARATANTADFCCAN